LVYVEEHKQHSIHPPREKLTAFVRQQLADRESEQIAQHLDDCEFCREFCDDYRLLQQSMTAAEREEITLEAATLAERLHREALTGKTISLNALRSEAGEPVLPLAADGERQDGTTADQTLTLYSEQPEVVLRVVRGSQPSDNYLQLISDDSSLVSHVLVQAPQLDEEYLTDEQGRADLGSPPPELTDDLKWQIKMPDAVFDLEPLAYDPNKTEYSQQIVLETEKQDKIEVTFEGKTEGKKLSLRIIALEGSSDFGEVTVVVDRQRSDVSADDPATFELADLDEAVCIRLFTK
jgi:hypothetical protein